MNGFFWQWLGLVVALSAFVVVMVSYRQSKEFMSPQRRVNPLFIFPDQFSLPFEKAVFTSADGVTLKGWFIPSEKSEKTIILMHGWGNNKGETMAATCFLNELGYNLLYFDFRGSGESGGEISTIGYLETRDFEAAMDYLRQRHPQCSRFVGLYGFSMGAAVAVYQAPKTSEVKCVVVEAVFDSYEKVVGRWVWNNKKIPYYPFMPLMFFFARARLDADPEAFSPIYNIDKISPKPLLMIHGSHDGLSPLKDAKKLFEKAGRPKQMWVVPGAAHSKCAETGGAQYRQRLGEFFGKYL
ncbi:MAG: alpha/beta hydrolase [Elusimicrobia bacterium]|nr:alpha/beta hydrolase [Elusimicrobiota bacterium]